MPTIRCEREYRTTSATFRPLSGQGPSKDQDDRWCLDYLAADSNRRTGCSNQVAQIPHWERFSPPSGGFLLHRTTHSIRLGGTEVHWVSSILASRTAGASSCGARAVLRQILWGHSTRFRQVPIDLASSIFAVAKKVPKRLRATLGGWSADRG